MSKFSFSSMPQISYAFNELASRSSLLHFHPCAALPETVDVAPKRLHLPILPERGEQTKHTSSLLHKLGNLISVDVIEM